MSHYAWSFVDALDRFRILWELQPNSETIPPPFSKELIKSRLSSIRNVRNISDHLAQRADYIISKNGAALGILGWVTKIKDDPLEVLTFLIVPGHLRTERFQLPIPKETKFTEPTDFINITAGEHTANLTDAYLFLTEIVAFLCLNLDNNLKHAEPEHSHNPSNVIMSAELNLFRVEKKQR